MLQLSFLGILTFVDLRDRPLSSKRFSASERSLAYARLIQRESREAKPVRLVDVKSAFMDYRIFIMEIVHCGSQVAQSSITVFLPTITAALGYTIAQAQLLSALKYCVGFITTTMASYALDRTQTVVYTSRRCPR